MITVCPKNFTRQGTGKQLVEQVETKPTTHTHTFFDPTPNKFHALNATQLHFFFFVPLNLLDPAISASHDSVDAKRADIPVCGDDCTSVRCR